MRTATQPTRPSAMRVLALLLFCSPRLAAGLAASSWVRTGRAPSSSYSLGLLPFPLEEGLLPGETKQVHLFEARFIQLFAEATEKHDGCVGAMLFSPNGNVASVTTLLEIEEYKKQEFGVWAKLKCVGRVRLTEVKQTDFEYVMATCEPFFDEEESTSAIPSLSDQAAAQAASLTGDKAAGGTEDEGKAAMMQAAAKAAAAAGVSEEEVLSAAQALLFRLEDQVAEVHASVVEMQRQLSSGGGDGAAADDDAEERVEWGHELRDQGADVGRTLDELVRDRREVLLSRGLDALPLDTLLEPLADVWNVGAEAQAERQLLSFAAAAALSPSERVQALSMRSTSERLTLAVCALRERQRQLAAKLALRKALPEL